jgi:hypothetical protein
MFKDVPDLLSVEMKSEQNCEITSMISTFENCENLNSFKITGFNGEKIKSMKKLFIFLALIVVAALSVSSCKEHTDAEQHHKTRKVDTIPVDTNNTNWEIFIGTLIQQELKNQERTVSWLARKLDCDRTNVYNIFRRQDIDTELLMRISIILHRDFFSIFSKEAKRRISSNPGI